MLKLFAFLTVLAFAMPAFADSKCCTQTNGGGNTPGGVAVGVPNTNQGGNAPPGQQPAPPGQDK